METRFVYYTGWDSKGISSKVLPFSSKLNDGCSSLRGGGGGAGRRQGGSTSKRPVEICRCDKRRWCLFWSTISLLLLVLVEAKVVRGASGEKLGRGLVMGRRRVLDPLVRFRSFAPETKRIEERGSAPTVEAGKTFGSGNVDMVAKTEGREYIAEMMEEAMVDDSGERQLVIGREAVKVTESKRFMTEDGDPNGRNYKDGTTGPTGPASDGFGGGDGTYAAGRRDTLKLSTDDGVHAGGRRVKSDDQAKELMTKAKKGVPTTVVDGRQRRFRKTIAFFGDEDENDDSDDEGVGKGIARPAWIENVTESGDQEDDGTRRGDTFYGIAKDGNEKPHDDDNDTDDDSTTLSGLAVASERRVGEFERGLENRAGRVDRSGFQNVVKDTSGNKHGSDDLQVGDDDFAPLVSDPSAHHGDHDALITSSSLYLPGSGLSRLDGENISPATGLKLREKVMERRDGDAGGGDNDEDGGSFGDVVRGISGNDHPHLEEIHQTDGIRREMEEDGKGDEKRSLVTLRRGHETMDGGLGVDGRDFGDVLNNDYRNGVGVLRRRTSVRDDVVGVGVVGGGGLKEDGKTVDSYYKRGRILRDSRHPRTTVQANGNNGTQPRVNPAVSVPKNEHAGPAEGGNSSTSSPSNPPVQADEINTASGEEDTTSAAKDAASGKAGDDQGTTTTNSRVDEPQPEGKTVDKTSSGEGGNGTESESADNPLSPGSVGSVTGTPGGNPPLSPMWDAGAVGVQRAMDWGWERRPQVLIIFVALMIMAVGVVCACKSCCGKKKHDGKVKYTELEMEEGGLETVHVATPGARVVVDRRGAGRSGTGRHAEEMISWDASWDEEWDDSWDDEDNKKAGIGGGGKDEEDSGPLILSTQPGGDGIGTWGRSLGAAVNGIGVGGSAVSTLKKKSSWKA